MITNDDVKKVAFLSRLKFDDDKVTEFAEEFNKILNWVAEIDEIDTSNVEPLTCVNNTSIELRLDEVLEGNQAKEVLENAPNKEFGYFVVPKVVE
ncbi:MAG: Asp-tRNA(Asn)/Glu-tRNA(Gln) amidotransferase subunit GatC [Alphaproteobacteria bacterium]